MRRHMGSWVWLPLMLLVSTFAFAHVSAAQTTTTETKAFEVIAVDGNSLVLRGAEGTKEYMVPEGFRFNIGGREMTVAELRPGMKGTATITTTTTVKPVSVTEVKNGEVVHATGGMIIVRGPKGFQSFTQADVDNRQAKILRDGKPIQISELRTGDRLTATIVTERPPQILTDRQVKATITDVARMETPAAGGAASAAAPRAATTQSAQAATTPARTLPKTASPLPLLALIAGISLSVGGALRLRRRSAR
jgi:hypothetical protein